MIESFMFRTEHSLFRKTVRNFIDAEINPHVDEWEAMAGFPAREVFEGFAKLGCFGLSYPERVGGLGLDYWYTVVFAEELGRIDCGGIPMSLSVQSDMCTPALARYGSPYLVDNFLKPAISGRAIGAIAITEPNAGTDMMAIQTIAEEDGDFFTINGSKTYITNGTIADFLVTLCRHPDGTQKGSSTLIVVPRSAPGLRATPFQNKLGNLSCDHATVFYKNVRVSRNHCIGEPGNGFEMQMDQFTRERLFLGILYTAQARRILTMTQRYAANRKSSGKPLNALPLVGNKLIDLDIETECTRHFGYACAGYYDTGNDCLKEAAMLKLKAAELLVQVANECFPLFGGLGYLNLPAIQRAFRDVQSAAIAGGTAGAMRNLLLNAL